MATAAAVTRQPGSTDRVWIDPARSGRPGVCAAAADVSKGLPGCRRRGGARRVATAARRPVGAV